MKDKQFALTDCAITWKPILDCINRYLIIGSHKELSIEERNILSLEIETSSESYFNNCKGLERACGLKWEDEFVALFIPIIAVSALNNLRPRDDKKELILVDKKVGNK